MTDRAELRNVRNTVTILDQAPEQAIKQVGDALRARARANGSFDKPAHLEFGLWLVMLSFGTAQEMEKRTAMERMERERQKLPALSASYRAADTWHFSVRPKVSLETASQIDPEAVKQAHDELARLLAAVGVPPSQLLRMNETPGRHQTITHWQWRDE